MHQARCGLKSVIISKPMMRIAHILLLLFLVMQLDAQQYDEVKISVKEILQYQCVKAKFGEVNAPFRKFGF